LTPCKKPSEEKASLEIRTTSKIASQLSMEVKILNLSLNNKLTALADEPLSKADPIIIPQSMLIRWQSLLDLRPLPSSRSMCPEF